MPESLLHTEPDLKERPDYLNGVEWVVKEPEKKIDTELEVLRSKALENLQSYGVIEIISDGTGKRAVVFDQDFFDNGKGVVNVKEVKKEMKYSSVIDNTSSLIRNNPKYGDGKYDRTLMFVLGENQDVALRDFKVISRTDYEKTKKELGGSCNIDDLPNKSFFYIPDNEEAAFDPIKIKDKLNKSYYIYGASSNERDQTYPTIKNPSIPLNLRDVILAAKIYGENNAFRDDNDVLWVDDPNDPGVKRRFTTQWLSRTVGYRIDVNQKGEAPVSPLDYIKGLCPNLYGRGLLKDTDFKTNEKPRYEVSKGGAFFLENNLYYLGKKYRGCAVTQLSESKYAVSRKLGDKYIVEMVFDKKIVDDSFVHDITPPNKPEGTYLYISQRGVQVMKPSFIRETMDSEGKKIDKQYKTLHEANDLITFRKSMEELGLDIEILNNISFEEQVAINNEFQSMSPSEKKDFVKLSNEYGIDFLNIVAARTRFGGLDHRVLNLSKIDADIAGSLINEYQSTIEALKKWSIVSTTEVRNDNMKMLMGRVEKAFEYKMGDFLLLGSIGNTENIINQLNNISETLNALHSISTEDGEYPLERFIKNVDPFSKEVTSVTGRYLGTQNNLGKVVNITFRPFEVDGEKGKTKAGAGMRVSFTDQDGNEFKFRIDMDDFGISLDIGDGKSMGELFGSIERSHHVQEPFYSAFGDKKAFGAVIKALAENSGCDFSKT